MDCENRTTDTTPLEALKHNVDVFFLISNGTVLFCKLWRIYDLFNVSKLTKIDYVCLF